METKRFPPLFVHLVSIAQEPGVLHAGGGAHRCEARQRAGLLVRLRTWRGDAGWEPRICCPPLWGLIHVP